MELRYAKHNKKNDKGYTAAKTTDEVNVKFDDGTVVILRGADNSVTYVFPMATRLTNRYRYT